MNIILIESQHEKFQRQLNSNLKKTKEKYSPHTLMTDWLTVKWVRD